VVVGCAIVVVGYELLPLGAVVAYASHADPINAIAMMKPIMLALPLILRRAPIGSSPWLFWMRAHPAPGMPACSLDHTPEPSFFWARADLS
jgi:hypothetical protein